MLILGLFAVTQPGLGLTLIGLVATILAYPLVVILAGRAFGLRKIVPGEVDRLGHRQ
jgi:rod shape-determining protein MreD